MGHIHLLTLPRTKQWKEVVRLLETRASPEAVIAASAVAAEREFAAAPSDPVFVEAVRLLALIPQAARSPGFGRALREFGIEAPDSPHLADILAGANRALERIAREGGKRSDFTEIVRRALLGTLAARIGDELPGLFSPDAGNVQAVAARMARPGDFSNAARSFFGRLTADTLAYWLDRTLALQVGENRRFADLGARAEFDRALERYCTEATRIIREFAGGWYGKTLSREGSISHKSAAAFGAVAFKKIAEELRVKRDAHA